MAQKYVVQIVDDFDGTVLEQDDAEEVRFGLDRTAYAIDLSHANAAQLREALARYTAAARTETAPSSGRTRRSPNVSRRQDLDQIRAWANSNGHTVSGRGRIADAIIEAYDAAH